MKKLLLSFCFTLVAIASCQLVNQPASQEKVLLMEDVSMKSSEQEAARYLADLDNPDENVRSEAALALQRMGHPRALEACLRTLNDAEDMLHLDYTPSVRCLIEIGQPALEPLLTYLLREDEITRLRAQRAVEGITIKLFKVNDENSTEVETRWRKWWKEMGYAYDADPEGRQASVTRLRNWTQSR